MKTLVKTAVIIFTLALTGCEQQKYVQGPSAKSPQEWAKELHNKTRKEIVSLLGTPDYSANEGHLLCYSHLYLEPVTGVKKGLTLIFFGEGPAGETLTHISDNEYKYPGSEAEKVENLLR